MTEPGSAPGTGLAPSGEPHQVEEELRRAAAMIFVEDLSDPTPTAPDTHHLLDVLRLRPGEVVAVGDGRGSWQMCELASPVRGAVRLEPTSQVRTRVPLMPEVGIGLAVAKGDRTDWAVQKLVEVGVDRIELLVSGRSVVRPDPHARPGRRDRLQRIVREAAMQARRVFLPVLEDPAPLAEVVSRVPGRVALAEPSGSPVGRAATTVLVGPEGGWSPDELELVSDHVSLSDAVLRVETAAIVAGVLLCALRDSTMGSGSSCR